jgi:hypothetical protein
LETFAMLGDLEPTWDERACMLREVDFNLPDLLWATIGRVAGKAQRRGSAISAVIAPAARGWFWGDADRLSQILATLAAKAVGAGEDAVVSFDVSGAPHDDGRVRLCFSVHHLGLAPRWTDDDIRLRLGRQLAEPMGGWIGMASGVSWFEAAFRSLASVPRRSSSRF